MKISEVMTRDVKLASPDQSIREAARMMASIDAGAVPVGENDRLVGMITDRDIAVRAIAQGKGPDAPIREIMTRDIEWCFEDEEADAVSAHMSERRVRRLPVLNRDKRLVGIISLGDLACDEESAVIAGSALSGISQPGGEHSQTSDGGWR